jgi:hypothetical protein
MSATKKEAAPAEAGPAFFIPPRFVAENIVAV